MCFSLFRKKKTMEWKQIRSQFIISYHRLQKRKICIPNNWYATCVINDYTHDLLITKLLCYISTTKFSEIMIWVTRPQKLWWKEGILNLQCSFLFIRYYKIIIFIFKRALTVFIFCSKPNIYWIMYLSIHVHCTK